MIRINPTTYWELFKTEPNWQMILSGWKTQLRYFLYIIPYIEYTKPLIK